MRFRKLRIAWSVGCGLACVLLIALWVRSYYWLDNCLVVPNYAIVSLQGKLLSVARLEVAYGPQDTSTLFDHYHPPIRAYSHRLKDITIVALTATTTLPIWIPIILFATLAAIPWIRWFWHFSLRTLLIATTLFAVVLGLIVYAVR